MDSNIEYIKTHTIESKESNEDLLDKGSISGKRMLVTILLLIFVRPHFSFIPDIISVYWPDIMILLVSIVYLINTDSKNNNLMKKVTSFKLSELLILMFLLFPILINFMVYEFSFDILFAYSKLIYYYIVFLAITQMANNACSMKNTINKIIYFGFIFNFIISLIQLLAIPVLFDFISIIYGTEKLRTIWTGYARVYGAFYNANWFGVYLLFVISWINEQMINREIKRSMYFMGLIFIVIMLVISGSRTAVLGAILVTAIQFMRGLRLKKIFTISVVFIPVLIGLVSIIGRIEILNRTFGRFTNMIDLISSNGLSIETLAGSRWPEWQNSISVFYESPWIGSSIENFIPHNSYISILIRFGIIGTIAIFLLTLTLSRRFKSTNNISKNKVYFGTASLGLKWGFLFVCIGGDYLFSTQVMLLLVASLSIMYVSLRKKTYTQ